jgi:hypothetical protein
MKTSICLFAAILSVVSTLCCRDAQADEFSINCLTPGYEKIGGFYFTFDDRKKRVVMYDFRDGHLTRGMYDGRINGISADKIQFELHESYNPKLVFGDAELNRASGSMAVQQQGRALTYACEPIPLRSVMDLWELLDRY